MNTPKLPSRLRRDTILEAVAECRFQPKADISPGGLLPGLLFRELEGRYTKLEPLPISKLPPEIRSSDASLAYAPTQMLRGEGSSLLIGDRVLGVTINRPYIGWIRFKPLVEQAWRLLQNSGVVHEVERISVKYLNLLPANLGEDHFALTKTTLSIGQTQIARQPTTLRSELLVDGKVIIVNMMSQASVRLQGSETTENGLVVEIDSILKGPFRDFWNEFPQLLEDVHTLEKQVFFQIPSDAELERYGPEY